LTEHQRKPFLSSVFITGSGIPSGALPSFDQERRRATMAFFANCAESACGPVEGRKSNLNGELRHPAPAVWIG
jgi:hypothetical protein